MRNKKYLIILFLSLGFGACQKELLEEEFDNSPAGNFDALWNEFDRTYGAFEAKHINWDSLYKLYRPSISENTSEIELYQAMTGLLTHLNDGHVQLTASGFKRFFSSGIRPLFPDSKYYDSSSEINTLFALLKTKYLYQINTSEAYLSAYMQSWCSDQKIAYIYVPSFSKVNFPADFIDKALDEFTSADALIIDLRFNGGGATETFLHMLNKLSNQRRLYLKSRLRNGPEHSDYTKVYDHYMEPKYGVFAPKPLVVLVNRFSASSSEHFMLGIQSLPYATVVGDTTYGALSTVLEKVLPNGWSFRTCPQVLCDTLGHFLTDSQGRYPDGVGLAPDVYIVNYYKDIVNRRDYMLETAIRIIEKSF